MAILEVTVDAGAPAVEMEALEEAFNRAGIEASVKDNCLRHGADALPYVITFAASVTWLAGRFAGGFLGKAGEDSWDAYRDGGWKGLASLIRELSSARANRDGTITIEDPSGPDLRLSNSIPDDALQELSALDWSAMTDGWLMWHEPEGDWWFVQTQRAPGSGPAPRRS